MNQLTNHLANHATNRLDYLSPRSCAGSSSRLNSRSSFSVNTLAEAALTAFIWRNHNLIQNWKRILQTLKKYDCYQVPTYPPSSSLQYSNTILINILLNPTFKYLILPLLTSQEEYYCWDLENYKNAQKQILKYLTSQKKIFRYWKIQKKSINVVTIQPETGK